MWKGFGDQITKTSVLFKRKPPIQVDQRYLLCVPHVFTNLLNFDTSIILCWLVQSFLHWLTFQRFRLESLNLITLITTFVLVFFYVFSFTTLFKMVLISLPQFPVEMDCATCISLEVLIEISKLFKIQKKLLLKRN